MSIGMIFGGMAEGLGAGMVSAAKTSEAAALAAQKSDASLNAQLQVLEAKRQASMEVLMAKLEAKGAGGEGGGKAQPFSEELTNETAAYETGSTGAEVARRRAIARGEAPMVEIPGKDIPSAAAVDTAAVGPNGEDYSDAMTRRLQQQAATPTVRKEVDQAAMDDYKKHAAEMGSSIRRSANPKESKNMAEAGLLDQRRGLVGQAVDKGIVGPGEGALLTDAKPAYNKEVSLATGKSTDVGKSEIRKNDGAANKDNSDANDKNEGGVKPKDQKDWLDNERKSIDTERADIRRREAELADITKSATMTDDEKKAAKADLVAARANVNRREQNWQSLSEKVGANIMNAPTRGTGDKGGIVGSRAYGGGNVDGDATTERRYLLERELKEERAKPIEGAYTQAKKDEAIKGLERSLADLKDGGMAKVDTSRMGGQQSTAPKVTNKPAEAPAAPAAPKAGAYKSADEVKAAYQRGDIDKNQARAALKPFGFN